MDDYKRVQETFLAYGIQALMISGNKDYVMTILRYCVPNALDFTFALFVTFVRLAAFTMTMNYF